MGGRKQINALVCLFRAHNERRANGLSLHERSCLALGRRTRRSAQLAALRLRQSQRSQTQAEGPIWLSWKGLFKKQLLLKEACSGTNDEAMKPFGSRLKEEAARHKEVYLCDSPWGKRLARPPPGVHLPSPSQLVNARRTQMTRIILGQQLAAEMQGQPTASDILKHSL